MNLLEYEAKTILSRAGVLTPSGVTVANSALAKQLNEPALPAVVKSQVPTGGRGKLGGVRVVKTNQELKEAVDTLFARSIKGYLPQTLLIEELLDIDKEFYFALMIDRSRQTIELAAHTDGGVEIESHKSEEFLQLDMFSIDTDSAGEALAELYGLPEKTFALQDLVTNLYNCFVQQDCVLLEINPLVLTKQGQLVAGDCKMVMDDAAAFRHPEWEFEEGVVSANFVTLDEHGTVATIANGAGLAMATVDAVTAAGRSPANFLDIGGNATTEQVVESFRKIIAYPNVDTIVINIFGGIVRCDTVAQAIVEAREQVPHLPRLIIRLSGNRSQEAAKLLSQHNLKLYSDLTECIEALA